MHFLLLSFLILCLLNNVALPIFEAPDEASHFRYAHYLADERRLPDLERDLPSHEVTQPVLYYALVALVISPFDRSNLDQLVHLNPDWFEPSLNPGYTGVRGQHLHTDAERFPYQGAVWAVRAARLLSSLLGAAAVALVYLTAGSVFGASRPVLAAFAAAVVAFNPKFIHISSIVSNDIAITLAATTACWWMVRLAAPPPSGGGREGVDFFILGALIGLAVLCKLQGLGLFAPALAAVWLIRPHERRIRRVLVLLAGFVLIAGWWFVFNTLNYGHPLAWAQVQEANAALLRIPPLSASEVIATLPLWFTSYWGNVGIELHYDGWLNAVLFFALALAVTGCVVAVAKGLPLIANRIGLLLLVIWEIAIVAMFIWWLCSYVGTENSRLIMPGIAPVAVLVVLGWATLVPRTAWRALAVGVSAALFAVGIATPFTTIAHAYATPDAMEEDQLLARHRLPPVPSAATFDGAIKLLHAELDRKRVNPGESVGVTLYWGALQPINQSYRVVLEALDGDGELIGRRQFIPFNGRFATQRWEPNQFFRDDYALPIDATARGGVARIQLGLFHAYPLPGLARIDGANTDKFLIGRVKVDATANVAEDATVNPIAVFGDMIRLDRVHIEPDRIIFDWTALMQPDKDYTLFLHIMDVNGHRIGQFDAQPFDGQYPTGLWDRGERVRDVRAVALPEGATQLRLGWYDSTGQRLPARKADGSLWQDDIVLIDVP